MDYPCENNTCLEVKNLGKMVDIIGENNVDDEVVDDTIPLEPITKEALIAFRYLHNILM